MGEEIEKTEAVTAEAEIKAKLEAKFGPCVAAELPGAGTFYFKRADQIAAEEFTNALMRDEKDGGNKAAAFRQLCVRCLVSPQNADGSPARDALQAAFQMHAFAATEIAGAIRELDAKISVKKL